MEKLSEKIIEEIKSLSSYAPKERLPKEEQIRCVVYDYYKQNSEFVCVERNYEDVDAGKTEACDLLIYLKNGKKRYIEIKTCWYGSYFTNKLKEQKTNWENDIERLRRAKINPDITCHFILIGLIERKQKSKTKLEESVNSIANVNLICNKTSDCTWRDTEIDTISVWIWCV